MSVEARLRLQITEFTRNYDVASAHAKKRSGEMARSAGGVGPALAAGIRSALPAISFAALGVGIKGALQSADDLADIKVALGETAETLQRVDFAAQQAASVGVEELAKSILKLEKNLGDMESKAASDALANLGLTASQLAAMPLDEKILALSGAFQKARAEGTGVKDIMDLLGRSGASLIPLLGQSQEAIEAMFANAPVIADALIDRMAILNDQFDAMVIKAKTGGVGVVGALSEVGTFLADLVKTGSIDEALLNFDDRQLDALKNIDSQGEAKRGQSEAMEASAAATAAAKEETDAAKDLEKALEGVAKVKEKLAQDAIDILPDDQKLDALKAKLADSLAGSVGNFSLNYDTSTEGLKKLAEDREKNKDLPAEGENSIAEAYAWLEEARKLESEIGKTEEKIAADKKKAADEEASRQKELADLRASAESGRVGMLSEAEQTAVMREQLGKSLAVEITGVADIERGLKLLRDDVDAARASGDVEGEKAALVNLNDAQKQAADFKSRILGEGGPARQGEFQDFVDEIFNRDPAAEQLRALRDGLQKQDDLIGRMDAVIKKMDAPPPRDIFSNFVD